MKTAPQNPCEIDLATRIKLRKAAWDARKHLEKLESDFRAARHAAAVAVTESIHALWTVGLDDNDTELIRDEYFAAAECDS